MTPLWIPKATLDQLQAGVDRERAEERASASYDANVQAPPCVACGEPVSDQDYDRHRYSKHAWNEMIQPSGRPDAREALFLAHDRAELEQKIAIWRSKHPGVGLAVAGEGTRAGGRLVWQRFRVLDARGKAGS